MVFKFGYPSRGPFDRSYPATWGADVCEAAGSRLADYEDPGRVLTGLFAGPAIPGGSKGSPARARRGFESDHFIVGA